MSVFMQSRNSMMNTPGCCRILCVTIPSIVDLLLIHYEMYAVVCRDVFTSGWSLFSGVMKEACVRNVPAMR